MCKKYVKNNVDGDCHTIQKLCLKNNKKLSKTMSRPKKFFPKH